MTTRRLGAAAALRALAVVTFGGCASPAPGSSVGTVASPILGGKVDTGDPAVVAVVSRRQRCAASDVDIVCTGTLVAPRVVLTAAHCLREIGPPGDFEVFFGDDTHSSSGRFIVARAGARHPQFDDAMHAYDVGVLLLAEAAPATPIPIASGAPAATFVGTKVRAVGFGRSDQKVAVDGKKREGTMTVAAIAALSFTSKTDPAMTCQGDSGGPVLGLVDGVERLVGITVAGDGECKDHATNGRLDVVWESFLRPYVDGTTPIDVAPSATASVPLASICETACATDADCPALLACVALPGQKAHCALPGGEDGDLTTPCTEDAVCGGGHFCQRIWPSGVDACRCSAPCMGSPGVVPDGGVVVVNDAGPVLPPPELVGGKCSIGAPPMGSLRNLVALSLVVASLARRRRR